MVSETKRAEPPEIPIACSLAADEMQMRLAEWQELLSKVRERRAVDGGVRLVFEPSTPAATIADLAPPARRTSRPPQVTLTFTPGILVLRRRQPSSHSAAA